MGILPRFPAAVAELADALDSGSSESKISWRFDSSQPHEYKGPTQRESGSFCVLAWVQDGPQGLCPR